MASLVQRGGRVNIRVGGNTQDYATLVPSLPNGEIIQKQQTGNTNPVSSVPLASLVRCWYSFNIKTETPTLDFTAEVFYLLGNVSALVNVHWYLGNYSTICLISVVPIVIHLRPGIPLNDSANLRMGIAEVGEAILGDKLIGFQVGNEPDLYSA